MKSRLTSQSPTGFQSPSPRRAWIEMLITPRTAVKFLCRPPHGGRGLKYECSFDWRLPARRPPHGGRGLKCLFRDNPSRQSQSPSPRRAWIEIAAVNSGNQSAASPSPRRAWIEISASHLPPYTPQRRPPHGGRGLKYLVTSYCSAVNCVALPTEGVD